MLKSFSELFCDQGYSPLRFKNHVNDLYESIKLEPNSRCGHHRHQRYYQERSLLLSKAFKRCKVSQRVFSYGGERSKPYKTIYAQAKYLSNFLHLCPCFKGYRVRYVKRSTYRCVSYRSHCSRQGSAPLHLVNVKDVKDLHFGTLGL